MKNVHLLSTDKLIKSAGDLVKDKYGSIHIFTKNDGKEYGKTTTKLNIYITSDEGIKEGDWFIHPDSSCFDKEWKEVSIGGYEILQVIKVDENFIYHSSMMAIHKNLNIKKIILTTDQDLIKDGVQAIDDEFLEWFVKNPSCEYVKVEEKKCTGQCWKFIESDYEETCLSGCERIEYEILIPKEELKHPKVFSENGNELFFDEQGNLIREQLDYTALLQPVGTRQETIEETYLNQLIDEANKEFTLDRKLAKDVAVKYANWQAERMYSKEEVIAIVEKSRETGLTAEYLLLTDQFKKK